MGRTILCSHCQSTFDESVLAKRAEPNICPVCGNSLLGNDDSSVSVDEELENPDMYFYDIDDEDKYEDKNWRRIYCNCASCREVNSIPYSNFSVIKSEYIKLKDGVEISCKGCGKAVTKLIIPKRPDGWRELNMWERDCDNVPKCPICSSTKIHKISMTNKAASALAFGLLATGHVSKTYKCDICGAKF